MSDELHENPGTIPFEVANRIDQICDGYEAELVAGRGPRIEAYLDDVPAGASLPVAHSHDAYEETIYGVAGTVTFTVEGTPHPIGPGETLFIPRGAVHAFANTGDVDATALAIITPGLLGADYFRELAAIVAAAGGPPDVAAIAEVMRRHGLTPALGQDNGER